MLTYTTANKDCAIDMIYQISLKEFMAHFLLSTTVAYEIEFAIKNNSLLFEQSVFKFQSQLYFDPNSQYSFRIIQTFPLWQNP